MFFRFMGDPPKRRIRPQSGMTCAQQFTFIALFERLSHYFFNPVTVVLLKASAWAFRFFANKKDLFSQRIKKTKPCPWAIWPIGLSTNPITKPPLDGFRLPVTNSYLGIKFNYLELLKRRRIVRCKV